MEPVTIIAALAPALLDGVRGLITRFTGTKTAPPANVAETILLMNADTSRLEKIASLEQAIGDSYAWVNAVRALQRPVFIAMILVVWVYTGLITDATEENREYVSGLMGAVIFYLLGDRTYTHFKGKK